ncbi:hypothetical protein [Desulfosporosinus sp.]|uniref:hypothetical protein n=1 Tax=Desulfosporosinus sp. TaxID=157907 RepID=UPI00262548AA|nr:hypothetical protein [Desulfosporosinus sp.]
MIIEQGAAAVGVARRTMEEPNTPRSEPRLFQIGPRRPIWDKKSYAYSKMDGEVQFGIGILYGV